MSDAAVRRRNESAWLLPAGQERIDHGLRQDMRHYRTRTSSTW